MAQTFLIRTAKKNSKGIFYRVVKDRSWDDMPWSFLVQVYKMNYSLGKDRWKWVCADKVETEDEAVKIFERKTR